MTRLLILTLALTIQTSLTFGQTLDSVILLETEIPDGYTKVNKFMCKTAHSTSLYDEVESYSLFLGKVTKKGFQSFQKGNDKGCILYFEFDKDFTGHDFLKELLWDITAKPTTQKPDEFYAKGKYLIVWSFDLDSEIKKTSKAKVQSVLK